MNIEQPYNDNCDVYYGPAKFDDDNDDYYGPWKVMPMPKHECGQLRRMII